MEIGSLANPITLPSGNQIHPRNEPISLGRRGGSAFVWESQGADKSMKSVNVLENLENGTASRPSEKNLAARLVKPGN